MDTYLFWLGVVQEGLVGGSCSFAGGLSHPLHHRTRRLHWKILMPWFIT